MDKALAREYVKKVTPLEHSTDPYDRAVAEASEYALFSLLQKIPEPRGRRHRDPGQIAKRLRHRRLRY